MTTNSTLVAEITDPNRTSFTDTNLSPNTTYFYKVFVFDKAGLSAESNEVSATTSRGIVLDPLFTIPGDPARSFLPVNAADSLVFAQGIWDHTNLQNGTINGVRLPLGKVGNPQDDFVVELVQIGDVRPRIILASSTVSLASLPSAPNFATVDVVFPEGVPTLDVNTVFLRRTGAPDAANYPVVRTDDRNPSPWNHAFTCSPTAPLFFCLETATFFPAHDVPLTLLGAPGPALPGSQEPGFSLLFGLLGNPLHGAQGIGFRASASAMGQTYGAPDAGTLREISLYLGRIGNPQDDLVISFQVFPPFSPTLTSASLPTATFPPFPAFRKVTFSLSPAIGSRDANLFLLTRSGPLDEANMAYVRHETFYFPPYRDVYRDGDLIQCMVTKQCFAVTGYDILFELYGEPAGFFSSLLDLLPATEEKPLELPAWPEGMGTSTGR